MKTVTFITVWLWATSGIAQQLAFDPGNWPTANIAEQHKATVIRANRMIADTMYVEDIDNGTLVMVTEPPALARLEFDPQTEQRLRRIDIRQEERVDTLYTEDLRTGNMERVVEKVIVDVPAGRYEEFHPNGAVKIRGTLNGIDFHGNLQKTGEWTEWDADGKVIRQKTYP